MTTDKDQYKFEIHYQQNNRENDYIMTFIVRGDTHEEISFNLTKLCRSHAEHCRNYNIQEWDVKKDFSNKEELK